MKKLFLIGLLWLISTVTFALNQTELQTLKTAILAETDPDIVNAVAIRDDAFIAGWYNEDSLTLAWRNPMPSDELFENTPIAQFDGLTNGKRQAWTLMLSFDSINMHKNKMRKGVVDIWDPPQEDNILSACTEIASKGEMVFGGTEATSGTITATRRNWIGTLSTTDVSQALNLP